jgi:hypothetical protein
MPDDKNEFGITVEIRGEVPRLTDYQRRHQQRLMAQRALSVAAMIPYAEGEAIIRHILRFELGEAFWAFQVAFTWSDVGQLRLLDDDGVYVTFTGQCGQFRMAGFGRALFYEVYPEEIPRKLRNRMLWDPMTVWLRPEDRLAYADDILLGHARRHHLAQQMQQAEATEASGVGLDEGHVAQTDKKL